MMTKIDAVAAESTLRTKIEEVRVLLNRSRLDYQELAFLAESGQDGATQAASTKSGEVTELEQRLQRLTAALTVAARHALEQRRENLAVQRDSDFRRARAHMTARAAVAEIIDRRLVELAAQIKEFGRLGSAAHAAAVPHQPEHARHILAPTEIGEFVLGRLVLLTDLAHIIGYVPGMSSIGNRLYDAFPIATLAKYDHDRYLDRTPLTAGEKAAAP